MTKRPIYFIFREKGVHHVRLQKLVVVRHGCYDDTGLTEQGRRHIAQLAETLAQRLNDHAVALLSSPLKRAMETSEIIAARLGLNFDEHPCLLSGGYRLNNGQVEATLRLIAERSETYTAIILSTHLEFVEKFPSLWGATHGFLIAQEENVLKGTARVVDVQTGQVEILHPPWA